MPTLNQIIEAEIQTHESRVREATMQFDENMTSARARCLRSFAHTIAREVASHFLSDYKNGFDEEKETAADKAKRIIQELSDKPTE